MSANHQSLVLLKEVETLRSTMSEPDGAARAEKLSAQISTDAKNVYFPPERDHLIGIAGDISALLAEIGKTTSSGALESLNRRRMESMLAGKVAELASSLLNLQSSCESAGAGFLVMLFADIIAVLFSVLNREGAGEADPAPSLVIDSDETPGRKLLDLMPVGVVLVDESLQVFFVNALFKRMSGWSDLECIGGDLSTFLIDPITGKQFTDSSTIFSRSFNATLEVRLATKDYQLRIVNLSLLWGQIDGKRLLLANFLDTTADFLLRKWKSDLANMVRHDLVAPLASIRLMSEVMGSDKYSKPTERGVEALKLMHRECIRLERLVNDLLDLSKSNEVGLLLAVANRNIAELAAEVIEIMAKQSDAKGMHLESKLDPSLELPIDRDRIAQVLTNLVGNAIKYCPPESRITIEQELDGDYVKLVVADNGPGIPAEEHSKIFERYHRVKAVDGAVQTEGGHGLGLAICKLLVEAHDGTIGVVSAPGGGSRFWIRLPAQRC